MNLERLTIETNKIAALLTSDDIDERQYDQLYAAQQALCWAMDERGAKNPVAVILQRKIIAPERLRPEPYSLPTDIQVMTADCPQS